MNDKLEVASKKQVVKAPKTAVSNLTLGSADDALTLATELQKFVRENKLTSNIQGKEFPNVEAWQFAGTLLGLSAMLEDIEDKSTDQQIKWNATVKIVDVRTGNEVGRGFATCSNKESTKKFFADYAICSMAQTRAVGKAYRLALGWLMKAAGYEATPMEEMSEVYTSATVVTEAKPVIAPVVQVAGPADNVPEGVTGGNVGESAAPVQYATASQKEEIIHLLNHPLITRQEKTKMLLNINRLDEERATQTIAKLRKAIEDREGTSAVAA